MLLFGDSLENKEDGLTDIINFLEQKFGVSQHSEIVRKLKDSYTTVLKYSLFIVNFQCQHPQLQLITLMPASWILNIIIKDAM